MKKALTILFGLIIGCLFLPVAVRAAGASLYFSPNSGTFYVGHTFNVSIFVNTGGNNVNAVRVDLKFDPKKLQIASPTAGRSFISVWISQPSYSNIEGTASFQGGVPSPGINTSSGLVSTITFRAVAPGETSIYFLNSSRVLLNDGKGTNVLSSLGQGVYTLSIPPPEGPRVFSSTHPDQNRWYKNNNPTFSWEKEPGVEAFSYSLDQDSQGAPDNVPDGEHTSVSFSDLKDGLWYFHIKAKKGEVWGGVSHYLVQIDSSPPASFKPKISPSEKTSVAQPIVSFITTDALSGFDHFEVKVIDISPERKEKEAGFFVEAVSPYKLPVLERGKYMVVVRAFDKASNWRDESLKLEVIPRGFAITKEGIWLWELLIPWWLIILILVLLILLILAILLYIWRRHKKKQAEMQRRLEERERYFREEAERIRQRSEEMPNPPNDANNKPIDTNV